MRFKPVDASESASSAEPIAIVSADVLLVPMSMMSPAVPVPRLIVIALLPVPRLTMPVVPASSETVFVVFETNVSAPVPVILPFVVPVPPLATATVVPFHVPVVTTPVFAVMTRPLNPVAPVMAPESARELSVPTLVSEEPVTFDASVVPEMSAAAFIVSEVFGKVIVLDAVGSVMANVVLFAFAVAPSNTSGEPPAMVVLPSVSVPDVAVRLSTGCEVSPFEPVSVPADVTTDSG